MHQTLPDEKAFLTCALIVVVTALVSFIQHSEPHYENLKVLPQNTTKQEMDSIMRHFSLSLGVRCNFCHVREEAGKKDFDFASDKNEHKLAARYMYKMMMEINEKYFEYKHDDTAHNMLAVTCNTCHNGKAHPERMPPPPPPRN